MTARRSGSNRPGAATRGPGKRASVQGVSIARYENGKVVESWTSFDFLGLFQQLGVIPKIGAVPTAAKS